MCIERDEDVIWNTISGTVKLIKRGNFLQVFSSTVGPNDPILDEDYFFAMCQAGAACFGKRIHLEDIPLACPYCHGEIFEFVVIPNGLFAKRCKNCGLSGPGVQHTGNHKDWANANSAWRDLFYPNELGSNADFPQWPDSEKDTVDEHR